jgi:hypothetical protein
LVRYDITGSGFDIISQTFRYGQSGILVLWYDDYHGMHMIYEDRMPTSEDRALVDPNNPWEPWRPK